MERPWKGQTLARIVEFRGGGGRGGTRPLLALADSGEILHIKVQANPQSTMSLVNDWIGTNLGRGLHVPCPEVRLVQVNLTDLKAVPVLRGRRWRPGTQFATVFVPHCHSLPTNWEQADIPCNYDKMPLIALFEIWLDNGDLKISHIRRYYREGCWYLLVTDHGYIFPGGPRWTPNDLRRYGKVLRKIPVVNQLGMVHPLSFETALHMLSEVSRPDLTSLLNAIPDEWQLSRDRKTSVEAFLMRRLDLMPKLAESLHRRWQILSDAQAREL